jgi:hypothetical protein
MMDDDRLVSRRSADVRLDELFSRLGKIEGSLDVMSERVTAIALRLDREVLRRVEISEGHHADQDRRIDDLESFRDEAEGAFTLVKVLLGTSVLGVILTLVTLWFALSGHRLS